MADDQQSYRRSLAQQRQAEFSPEQALAAQYRAGTPQEVSQSAGLTGGTGSPTQPEQTPEEQSRALRLARAASATAQHAGEAAEMAGKGIKTAAQVAQPIASAGGAAVGGGIGAVGGAISGAVAGSVVPGAGTLAGLTAGARSGASAGAKTGQQAGRAAAKGVEAAGRGLEAAGKTAKESGKQAKDTLDAFGKISSLLKGKQVSAYRQALLFLLLVFAVMIDSVNLLGVSTILDWILDIIFWFGAIIATFEFSISSVFIRRAAISAATTIVEFIPVVDMLPFHVLLVPILYLDMKYDLFDKIKGAGIPTKPA